MSRDSDKGEPFPGAQDSDAYSGTLLRCAWRGCVNTGEYRAPKDRSLSGYYLFCLDHARAYNAQWNFHEGFSNAQLEAEIRSSATWDRPTWKLGTLGAGLRGGRANVKDPFNFSAGTDFESKRAREKRRAANAAPPDPEQSRALKAFGLDAPVPLEVLKRRYKILVKKHHPDANGGSDDAEQRMKIINAAYNTLKIRLKAAS